MEIALEFAFSAPLRGKRGIDYNQFSKESQIAM